MRIALFVTCLNDTIFPRAGEAVVDVLERLGHQVTFPLEQTCCGQMHLNSGYRAEAIPLLRRFVRVFGEEDVIVSPSGSCVAMVREQYPRLALETGDAALIEQVAALAPRVHELSELLIDVLEVEDVGATYPHAVAYHPSCHGLRTLQLGDRPLRLLRNVRELTLVELADADECCGFGGTFAVKNADTSAAMLSAKLERLLASGAEACVAGDSSCLMHIGGGLARRGAAMRPVHLAEVLAATGADAA